jgi:hypothetical protein
VPDTVVVKRAEELLLEGVPQSQLGGDAPVEPTGDVLAVQPFRGRGQSEQDLGTHLLQQRSVRGRRGVVELVHHDHVEGIGIDRREPGRGQGLDRGEHVVPRPGNRIADQEFSEVAQAKDLSEHAARLLEDLLAVGHEQQPRKSATAAPLGDPCVVERGDECLAGPGGCDDEVATAAVDLAFAVQVLQHDRLMRVGPDLER